MNIVPRYDMPNGSELSHYGRAMLVKNKTSVGYSLIDIENNQPVEISFPQFADILKVTGTRINKRGPDTGDRIMHRLGGFKTARSLPDIQQEHGKFNFCLCMAIKCWRDEERRASGDPSFDVSIEKLNRRSNRLIIKKAAEVFFGKVIHIDSGKGGAQTSWTMYKGRTLLKHFRKFDSLEPDESPIDALVTLDHLKGNRKRRISHRLCELMTEAWKEIGLDLKDPSPANVMKYLEVLIADENPMRIKNGLPEIKKPSAAVLSEHRRSMVTPLEYLIATKGERYSKNKRARGSTDFRALLIGEYVEIDECKASLISSAKANGIWATLSGGDKAALEEIDGLIQSRLSILVMLDVASRMPLAWVISDQPKAIATIELFRMATREKTREKVRYGCRGFPAAAVGIGHVKSDNGTGLRNAQTIEALLGVGAMFTFARTYSATDKPYVERMFGTVESVLFKIIHGYTGRKSGDLPGYDSVKNGVLDIDELYSILTRFMIDEYPSMRHSGADMAFHRPHEVYQKINQTRGQIPLIDPMIRRIHLGFEDKVTPSDEGVRVFSGIWFNSDQFQRELEVCQNHAKGRSIGKISVFIDPDDLNRATALLPGVKEPIELFLQITAFADLSLPEVLDVLAAYRKKDPQVTDIYDDMIMAARRDRHEQLKKIGVERKLGRSFSTVEECRMKAAALLRGARIIRPMQSPLSLSAEGHLSSDLPRVTFPLGPLKDVVEGESSPTDQPSGKTGSGAGQREPAILITKISPLSSQKLSRKTEKIAAPAPKEIILGRPKQLKELE